MSNLTSVAHNADSIDVIERQLASGRFDDASEVLRAGLALLDAEDARLRELRSALEEGEASGPAEPFDFEAFLANRRGQSSGA